MAWMITTLGVIWDQKIKLIIYRSECLRLRLVLGVNIFINKSQNFGLIKENN